MKKHCLSLILLIFINFSFSQEKTIVSDLENLVLDVNQTFIPKTEVINSDGTPSECTRIIYYNKRGVFSAANAISFDRREGSLKANEPGNHEVVAVCINAGGKRLTKTFYVNVNYPKVREVKLSLNSEKIFVGNYIPLQYEITDELNKTRIIDYWNSDVASKYFANVGFSIKALNDKIEIDDANNI